MPTQTSRYRDRAVGGDRLVLASTELKPFLLVALCCSPWTLPWTVQEILGVDSVDRPLLELHGVETGIGRSVNELFSHSQVAVVVDSYLSYQIQAHQSRPRSFGQC